MICFQQHTIHFSLAQSGDSPSSHGDANDLEVCIPNISLAERRKRLAAGIIQFVINRCSG